MKRTKKYLSLMLTVLMVLAIFVGCASNQPQDNTAEPTAEPAITPEATATEEPAPQETDIQDADADSYLNVLLNSEPSSLDVAKFLDTYSRSVMYNILEPLTRIQNGVVTGAGAETWEVSEDGLTYTFHLRDNKWSDGQAVVAGDYLYALQRQADPANA